jgi:hypothetical protein
VTLKLFVILLKTLALHQLEEHRQAKEFYQPLHLFTFSRERLEEFFSLKQLHLTGVKATTLSLLKPFKVAQLLVASLMPNFIST